MMKLNCPCGHELQIWETRPGERVRCPYCGRSVVVVEQREGKLKVRIKEPEQPAPRPNLVATWEDHRSSSPAPAQQAARAERPGGSSSAIRLAAAGTTTDVRHSWWHYLAGAWAYPLQGNAKWVLLLWVVLYVYVAPWFGFLWIAGLVVVAALLGALILYEFELVRQSAYTAEEAPTLPNSDDLYELAARPIGHLLAAVLAAGLPLLVVKVAASMRPMPDWWDGLVQGCYLLMAFVLPANLLAIAAADDWRAVNPVYTLRAITRIPFQYAVCCLTCIAFYVVACRSSAALAEAIGGMFLGTFLGGLVWVYLVSVAARILGTLHYVYQDRIGWLE